MGGGHGRGTSGGQRALPCRPLGSGPVPDAGAGYLDAPPGRRASCGGSPPRRRRQPIWCSPAKRICSRRYPTPPAWREFRRDTTLALISYPSAVYGFLGFNLAAPRCTSETPRVRRALAQALDRPTLASRRSSDRVPRCRQGPCRRCSGSGGRTHSGLDTARRRRHARPGRISRRRGPGVRAPHRGHPGPGHQYDPAESRRGTAGAVAPAGNRGNGDGCGLPGVPGAAGARASSPPSSAHGSTSPAPGASQTSGAGAAGGSRTTATMAARPLMPPCWPR